MGVAVLAEGKTIVFRTALIVGLGSVVATIIYLTPVPDRFPQSCSRTCHELDWPMICRIKLTLERYQTLSSECGDCPKNVTDCYRKHCITADGLPKGILTVNRQFPGPNLQVCQNDIMVIDVVNRIPGQSFGIHWRGQSQRETPFMDGVPMITQCPIPSFTTFQYKFRASNPGTHMWQVNTGEEALETQFGGFVVRQPDSRDPQKHLYDTDDPFHVISVHSWSTHRRSPFSDDSRSKLFINGKVEENGVPAAVFKVTSGKRHRFRVLFGGETSTCHINLSIDDHQFLVIALDGHPITPKMVTSVRLSSGERADFVLRADQPISSYNLRIVPADGCEKVTEASAIIRYDGAESSVPVKVPKAISVDDNELKTRTPEFTELITIHDPGCDSSNKESASVCVNDIHGLKTIPKGLATETPGSKFYLFFGFAIVTSQNVFNTSFVALDDNVKIPQTNNLTMMFPPSPLISQSDDINSDVICNSEKIPFKCRGKPNEICECVHLLKVPLGETVELVLVNQDENEKDHVFHLHGYSFYVLGASQLEGKMTAEIVVDLDKNNKLIHRNLGTPVQKDTLTLPKNGVVVIRFKADNPGYWLLDEEHSSHWSRGMSVVFNVGEKSDLPETPANFPKCGNWVGPEFFLA